VDLDFRVDRRGAGDYDVMMISSGTPDMGVQLNPDGTLSWDEERADGTGAETLLPAGASFGSAWIHLHWTSRVEGAVALTELRFDGNLVGTYSFESTALVQKPAFVLGDGTMTDPTSEWRVRVDNVTIDAR
jgi:hypothetical protein